MYLCRVRVFFHIISCLRIAENESRILKNTFNSHIIDFFKYTKEIRRTKELRPWNN